MFNILKVKKIAGLVAIAFASSLMLTSCSTEQIAENETITETTVKTEVQAIAKTPEELAEAMKDVTPVLHKTTDELITETLLKHYSESFPQNNPIKSVSYKMYLIEDGNPGEKKAYGLAGYYEFTIDGDEVVIDCGSGATPVAMTFSTDGKTKRVDYEVLTDGDYKSAEYKAAFPESVRKQIAQTEFEDRQEVEKKHEENAKKQYKEITGKELTKPINYVKKIPAN